MQRIRRAEGHTDNIIMITFDHFRAFLRTLSDEDTDWQRDRPTYFYGTLLSTQEVLLMGHHGLLTAADSVALAFDLHYYFEQVPA